MNVSNHRWRWLGLGCGVLLGLVFLAAALPKALDPVAFAEQISFEGLDFLIPAGLLAWAMIVVEAGLGTALVLGLRRRWVLVPTGVLVACFVFLTARAYYRWTTGELDEGSACGCFGNLVDRSPAEAFWQDLLLLVPPFLAAAWLGRDRTPRPAGGRAIAVVGIAALVGALAWAAPRLPLDDAATRLGVGVRVDEICAGADQPGSPRVCLDILAPELLEGRHLVAIDSLDSDDIEGVVDALDALHERYPEIGVWLLADADDQRVQTFFWEWGPRFEVREAPLPMLRPLYRTLPRGFELVDGTVTRTWAGLPEG